MKTATLVLALLALGAAAPATDSGAASAVRQAVAILDAERHGVTAFHRHYAYTEHGPGHTKTQLVDSIRVRDGSRLVAVRLLAQVSDGKAASPAELAKLQADIEKQFPPEDYELPLATPELAEYRFDVSNAPCNKCPAGSIAIAFTSLQRDDSHGDGIMTIDGSSHHILSMDFRPSVLPPHADSGSISIAFGPVLPDLWDVVSTTSHYTGHMFVFHGGADIVQTDSAYHRYKTIAQALADSSP